MLIYTLLVLEYAGVNDIVYSQYHPHHLSSEEELLAFRDEGVVYVLLFHV